MPNVPSPADSGTDPLPPRGTIPYFRAVTDRALAARGVKPQPWAPLAT